MCWKSLLTQFAILVCTRIPVVLTHALQERGHCLLHRSIYFWIPRKITKGSICSKVPRKAHHAKTTHLQSGHADAPVKSRRSKRKPGSHVLLTQIAETG